LIRDPSCVITRFGPLSFSKEKIGKAIEMNRVSGQFLEFAFEVGIVTIMLVPWPGEE
jgi:hypothetical protein